MTVSEQDDVLNRWRATRLVDTVSSIKSGAWGAEPASGGTLCIRIADFNTDNRAVVFKSRTMREIEKATLPGLLLKSGDLLVEKSGGGDKVPVGRIVMWQSDEEAITSNFISRIRLKSEYLPSYMSRVFQIQYVSGLSRKWLKQSTGIQNLDLASYLRETVPLPDLSEQILLSRYLDHAELRIAKAIQAKQKMVALLNEQKQVIISELVTRGLDPNVPMKDSGQAWLGQIPTHWNALPARSLFVERIERNQPDAQMLSVSIKHGVTSQAKYLENSIKKDSSNSDKSAYKVVAKDDLVYNKMRAWQGAAGVSEFSGIVSPAYIVLRARAAILPKYAHYVMRIKSYCTQVESLSYGISSDQWTLRPQHFKLIVFPVPSIEEQNQIVAAIDERTTQIDNAISAVEREIELLKEYRTVLISDVVTGKKDVRAEAADLPDVDPAELAHVLSGSLIGNEEEDEVDGTSETE